MRTHFISELTLPGKALVSALKDFDFYKLSRVDEVVYRRQPDPTKPESYSLELTARYDDAAKGHFTVTLRFVEVRLLILPEFSPTCYLSQIEIEDVTKNEDDERIEGVKYRTRGHGAATFEVQSLDIEVLSCKPEKS